MSYESLMDGEFDELSAVQRQILDVSDADVQVLTFTIGGQKYCVDVDPVSEVLWNEHDLAQVPDMASFVRGISNVRGRSVEVIDPKHILDVEADGPEENVILFEPTPEGDSDFAWLVDTVEQVLSISYDEVDESIGDDHIRGIIERDGELVTWFTHDCFSEEFGSDIEAAQNDDRQDQPVDTEPMAQ